MILLDHIYSLNTLWLCWSQSRQAQAMDPMLRLLGAEAAARAVHARKGRGAWHPGECGAHSSIVSAPAPRVHNAIPQPVLPPFLLTSHEDCDPTFGCAVYEGYAAIFQLHGLSILKGKEVL